MPSASLMLSWLKAIRSNCHTSQDFWPEESKPNFRTEQRSMDYNAHEKELKSKINDSADDLLRYAIFETCQPIEDHFAAIEALQEGVQRYDDLRIVILGSFLSSTWRNFETNGFISLIDQALPTADDCTQSIFFYLKAYDIFMRLEDLKWNKDYIAFLKQSVARQCRFVFNRYRLAQVSNRAEAMKLMEQCFDYIDCFVGQERFASKGHAKYGTIEPEKLSYERYVREYITGTTPTRHMLDEMKEFHRTLLKFCYVWKG